mmetsp:Transcript_54151/g.69587  ORF Transcript_54151/g.69587 Transcript_54151/m.69587 type:complete len:548 (-) Transcript_54151:147-1790(-)
MASQPRSQLLTVINEEERKMYESIHKETMRNMCKFKGSIQEHSREALFVFNASNASFQDNGLFQFHKLEAETLSLPPDIRTSTKKACSVWMKSNPNGSTNRVSIISRVRIYEIEETYPELATTARSTRLKYKRLAEIADVYPLLCFLTSPLKDGSFIAAAPVIEHLTYFLLMQQYAEREIWANNSDEYKLFIDLWRGNIDFSSGGKALFNEIAVKVNALAEPLSDLVIRQIESERSQRPTAPLRGDNEKENQGGEKNNNRDKEDEWGHPDPQRTGLSTIMVNGSVTSKKSTQEETSKKASSSSSQGNGTVTSKKSAQEEKASSSTVATYVPNTENYNPVTLNQEIPCCLQPRDGPFRIVNDVSQSDYAIYPLNRLFSIELYNELVAIQCKQTKEDGRRYKILDFENDDGDAEIVTSLGHTLKHSIVLKDVKFRCMTCIESENVEQEAWHRAFPGFLCGAFLTIIPLTPGYSVQHGSVGEIPVDIGHCIVMDPDVVFAESKSYQENNCIRSIQICFISLEDENEIEYHEYAPFDRPWKLQKSHKIKTN